MLCNDYLPFANCVLYLYTLVIFLGVKPKRRVSFVRKYKTIGFVALLVALGLPVIMTHPALAADGNVGQVENFIRSVIKVVAGLGGLVATFFFVIGGFGYITSSGNPERMDKSKRTLLWSGIGLAIVIGAFVLSNIVTDLATKAFG